MKRKASGDESKKRLYSIKWKLLALCLFLVVTPTTIFGVLAYREFKVRTYRNAEIALGQIAEDWALVAESYVQQLNRVLRREEVLVKQRLEAIAFDVKRMVELAFTAGPRSPSPTLPGLLTERLSEIEIGRSGQVFVATVDGRLLYNRDPFWQGRNFWDLVGVERGAGDGLPEALRNHDWDDARIFDYRFREGGDGRQRAQIAASVYLEDYDLVVGAATYHTDFKSYDLERRIQDEFRYRIAEQRIGRRGYIWVINTEGEYVVSLDRLRDGESVLEARDADGSRFVREIIARARQLSPGETGIRYYSWRNLQEAQAFKKVAAFSYVPAWSWIIGASAYEADFLEGLETIRWHFFLICAVSVVFGSLVGYVFASLISRPIQVLDRLSRQAAGGELEVSISEKITSRGDEVGSLANSFGVMIGNLRSLIAQKEENSQVLLEKNRQLADTQEDLERTAARAEKLAREATRANEAKSLFLANMSHELRTPLNAILGFSQLLERDPSATDDQRSNLAIINRSGEHLLGLINDILEMSKIEARRATLELSTFDLWQAVESIEEMMRLRAEGKGVRLIASRGRDVPRYVRADERKLRQVLVNLVGNAVKFTREGSVTLSVHRPEKGEAKNNRLVFEVTDTGPGIDPEEIPMLFTPFEQTRTGRHSGGGTGLGLAISQAFVRLMGGDIEVRSEPGQGSVFSFDIAFDEAEEEEILAVAQDRRVIGLAEGQPRFCVMNVEDNQANRSLLRQLLESVGFRVIDVEDGREALSMLEKERPDFIFMDIGMPVMDGYETTRRIRQSEEWRDLPVVALTASAFEEERERVLAAGCDDFLRKPFREQEIFDSLAEHLGAEYLYEDIGPAKGGGSAEDRDGSAWQDDFAELPAELREELRRATIELDIDGTLRVVERIGESNAALADALRGWVREFQFDRLQKLVGATERDDKIRDKE